MALDFTNESFQLRRLTTVRVRQLTNENWTQVPRVIGFSYRPEVIKLNNWVQITTASPIRYYLPSGFPSGFGTTITGTIEMEDAGAAEYLIRESEVQEFGANANWVANQNSSIQMQAKFNTGLNTDNKRYVTLDFRPVIFGAAWRGTDAIWAPLQAGNKLEVIRLPWFLMTKLNVTRYGTANFDLSELTIGYNFYFSNS